MLDTPGTSIRVASADSPVVERLRQALDLRNCALDAASTHFMVLDATQPGWPIVYVNRSLCSDHGYTVEELLGQSAATLLVDQEVSGPQLREINEALKAGRKLRTELQAVRKDGSRFWVGLSLGPVHNNEGRLTHFIAVGADITVRREEQHAKRELQNQLVNEMRERERIAIELRLAQKLESVGRLAAGVAHEINTPIQYVGDSIYFLRTAVNELEDLVACYQGALRRFSAGEPGEAILAEVAQVESKADLEFLRLEVPKAFERTLDGVGRVTGIVRAMKEFAHPDTNEQHPADINHAIETTLTVARNEYKYVARIETELEPLPEVICNIGELNQVFLNLIVNASHAISAAGKNVESGRIRIATAAHEGFVTIAIADNGCGIPRENLEKVFDPFFTTKEVGKGTGQGLAITRSIVIEKHAGKIELDSTVGIGTTFTIELPIAGRGA
jgi:two-component system, NtrC family, sensor kinase